MSEAFNLTSQPKELLVLADQVLMTSDEHDPLSISVPQHVQACLTIWEILVLSCYVVTLFK